MISISWLKFQRVHAIKSSSDSTESFSRNIGRSLTPLTLSIRSLIIDIVSLAVRRVGSFVRCSGISKHRLTQRRTLDEEYILK